MATYLTLIGAERGAGYSPHDCAIVTEDGGRYQFVYPTRSGKAPEMTRLFWEVPMTRRIEQTDLWENLDRNNGKDLVTLFLANTTYNVSGPTEYKNWDAAIAAARSALSAETVG